MRQGDTVEITTEADFTPYATVRAGERGTVIFIDPESGQVDVQLKRYHAGLTQYQNCVWFYRPYAGLKKTMGVPTALRVGLQYAAVLVAVVGVSLGVTEAARAYHLHERANACLTTK